MCKKYIYFASLFALISCGRTNMAPVEMKLDEDGDIVGYENTEPNNPQLFNEAKSNASNSNTYIVKSGETLFDIASKFNIDPMILAQINGIEYPYNVRPGQKLQLQATPSHEEEKIILPDEKEESTEIKSDKANKSEEKKEDLNGELNAMFAALDNSSEATDSKNVVKEEIKGSNGNSFLDQEEKLSRSQIKSDKKETKPVKEEKPKVEASTWVAPAHGKIISKFGDVVDGDVNEGIDIKASLGTPVNAVADGTVIYAGEGRELDPGYGKTVFIKHNKDDLVSSYTHLNDIKVKNGTKVKCGDVIGSVGKTGDITEPMLHFEMTKGLDANPVNPLKYVKF